MFNFCCFRKNIITEVINTSSYNEDIYIPPTAVNNDYMFNGIDYTYLKNIERKDTIPYIPVIEYGKVIKVYDGDTITICAKYPYEKSPIYRFQVRLNGIDSAEIHAKTPTEKKKAFEARDALHKLIFGKIIQLKNKKTEKWGRILADVYLEELHVNKWMLDNNYSVLYDGGTKQRPEEWN